jgi:hypothetical protein
MSIFLFCHIYFGYVRAILCWFLCLASSSFYVSTKPPLIGGKGWVYINFRVQVIWGPKHLIKDLTCKLKIEPTLSMNIWDLTWQWYHISTTSFCHTLDQYPNTVLGPDHFLSTDRSALFWVFLILDLCGNPPKHPPNNGCLVIAHPHILMWATSEQFLLALVTFSGSLNG